MTRDELKNKICTYFVGCGIDRSKLAQILKIIKDAASSFSIKLDNQTIAEFDAKTRRYIKEVGLVPGDEFHYRISWNFAPEHYEKCAEFVEAYLEILVDEYESEAKIEAEIQEAIGEAYGWDEHLYDELGAPSAAIVIFPDYIEVRAYENGVGAHLPKKGRKYVGCRDDIRWHFPLESLESLKNTGFPIVQAQ